MRKSIVLALLGVLSLSVAASEMAGTDEINRAEKSTATAIFAGGCFWCMEHPYDELEGVISTTSGYSGGGKENPTYQQVSRGGTGHAEVVRVTYDPAVVSYEALLAIFWKNIDPLDGGGQFCDRGDQYRSEIFVGSPEQRKQARASLAALEDSGRFSSPIKTAISGAEVFYPAEDYHQNYYLTNPVRYKYYRYRCGRDQRLQELWGL